MKAGHIRSSVVVSWCCECRAWQLFSIQAIRTLLRTVLYIMSPIVTVTDRQMINIRHGIDYV